MKRRDFVRGMVAASVTAKTVMGQQTAPSVAQTPPPVPKAPGPLPWMRGLMEVKALPMTPLVPDAVAKTDSHFFSDIQMATLRRLCEIFQPAFWIYPSALAAGTPEFLDFLIGISPSDRREMYQSGLDRLESDARQHFSIAFSAVNAAQADQLIRPWLRPWMNEHPPAEPYARFINIAHTDIRQATTNSEAWSEAARANGQQIPEVDLYWYPIEPNFRRESSGSAPTPQA